MLLVARKTPMKDCILYVHGFNSSPLSVKAQQTKHYLLTNFPAVKFFCPQLASSPSAAIEQLIAIIDKQNSIEISRWRIIGSSLGGYFAGYLAEQYSCPTVLVNPAIKPYELLVDYLGQQVNPYTSEVYQVSVDHIQQLKSIEPVAPALDSSQKNNYLVMVQTGDEVLNYQEAVDKYKNCQLIVQEGGDHSFTDFEQSLPVVCNFFHLMSQS